LYQKREKNKNDVVKQRERTNELKMEPVTGYRLIYKGWELGSKFITSIILNIILIIGLNFFYQS
jgi:hypothetical protein